MLCIFLLSACNNFEKNQHIEVFVIQTTEENNGEYSEKSGYKKVNSITSVKKGVDYIKTDIKTIEDFYDMKGDYISTEITHTKVNKYNNDQAEYSENRNKKIYEPSTILIANKNLENFNLENMTKEDEKKVKEHVLSLVDKLYVSSFFH